MPLVGHGLLVNILLPPRLVQLTDLNAAPETAESCAQAATKRQ